MEPDEVALSEVHISNSCIVETEHVSTGGYRVCSTKFFFKVLKTSDVDPVEYDEDGDLLVRRRNDALVDGCIMLEHTLATRIVDVGLQVWPGCILLCDFILHNQEIFADKIAVELGAGVGFASIILSTFAKVIFATDIGDDILETCFKNLQRNLHVSEIIHGTTDTPAVLKVREYNWLEDQFKREGNFSWTEEDVQLLSEAEVIIAADVIYDKHLTDALFGKLKSLLKSCPGKNVFIAVEKRLNFTLENMAIECPAYKHFMTHLSELKGFLFSQEEVSNITVEQMDIDFPEYVMLPDYTRNKYVELWKISSCIP